MSENGWRKQQHAGRERRRCSRNPTRDAGRPASQSAVAIGLGDRRGSEELLCRLHMPACASGRGSSNASACITHRLHSLSTGALANRAKARHLRCGWQAARHPDQSHRRRSPAKGHTPRLDEQITLRRVGPSPNKFLKHAPSRSGGPNPRDLRPSPGPLPSWARSSLTEKRIDEHERRSPKHSCNALLRRYGSHRLARQHCLHGCGDILPAVGGEISAPG